MTTWSDAKRYIHSNYRAEDVDDNLIKLVFETTNLRSQIVFVAHDSTGNGTEWIRVNSPIGNVEQIDLKSAAVRLSDKIVGGLVIYGDLVFVTNGVPLENLDTNELVEPMLRVLSIADELEAEFLGTDVH
ncbi:hypothetical protein ACGGZK_05095 [Agromyces sp. MMS24-K17]|uniref:hypothetical protein n=1 Tax=Agromyces sp. MMS24-K17 TaxID=3372850 RepID=UPI003754C825